MPKDERENKGVIELELGVVLEEVVELFVELEVAVFATGLVEEKAAGCSCTYSAG